MIDITHCIIIAKDDVVVKLDIKNEALTDLLEIWQLRLMEVVKNKVDFMTSPLDSIIMIDPVISGMFSINSSSHKNIQYI